MGHRIKIKFKLKFTYRINEYTNVFLLQYIALFMFILNIGGYIQRVYTVLFLVLVVMGIGVHGLNHQKKIVIFQMVALIYMLCNAVCGTLHGNDLHIAITNTFPIFFMIITEILVYSYRKHMNVGVILRKLTILSLFSSLAIIIATYINIRNGGIQEGYRFLAMQITCVGPLLLYFHFFYKKNSLFLASGIFSMVAIVCTYSKQMYVSIFIILLLIVFKGDKRLSVKIRNAIIISLALFSGVVVLQTIGRGSCGILGTLGDAFSYNFGILISKESLLTQETPRLTEMKYALERLRSSWLLGIGSGATYTTYGLQNWVHNGWLWMVLNFGIVGTALFCLPIFSIIVKSIKRMKKEICKSDRFVLFFLLTGVMVILCNGLFSPIFFREPATMVFLGLYLGMLIVIDENAYYKESLLCLN